MADARPFELQRLDHVVLRSADPERLVGFYEELGCSVVRRIEAAGLTQLRAGASMIDILDVAGPLGQSGGAPPGKEGRNVDHFALRVEPFDAAAIEAFCRARGIPAEATTQPVLGADGYGYAVYIRDPDGNRVELKGPPEPGG